MPECRRHVAVKVGCVCLHANEYSIRRPCDTCKLLNGYAIIRKDNIMMIFLFCEKDDENNFRACALQVRFMKMAGRESFVDDHI